ARRGGPATPRVRRRRASPRPALPPSGGSSLAEDREAPRLRRDVAGDNRGRGSAGPGVISRPSSILLDRQLKSPGRTRPHRGRFRVSPSPRSGPPAGSSPSVTSPRHG